MLDASEYRLQTQLAVCFLKLPQQPNAFLMSGNALLAKVEDLVYV